MLNNEQFMVVARLQNCYVWYDDDDGLMRKVRDARIYIFYKMSKWLIYLSNIDKYR